MYEFTYYSVFDYVRLKTIKTLRRPGKKKELYNNAVIMLDTETSKKRDTSNHDNHIVAFTLSIRADSTNICTLWGNSPVECMDCIELVLKAMPGDHTIIYVHNLAYDYTFLRRFLYDRFGYPLEMLNTDSHYPIRIEFAGGLVFRDSLILAQKSLERWALDMDVEHKKAVGFWDYDKIRNQGEPFTPEELKYIENDTLAGVECIDKLSKQLHHYIYAMPYTATGIVRETTYKIGNKNRAHEVFERISPPYQIYKLLELCFHGGYTHANRYLINEVIKGFIECYDFTSSYPYCMLAFKYPMGQFTKFRDASIDELVKLSDKYAFITKLILIDVEVKDNTVVMPVLQASKVINSVNVVADNGRILQASYVEIEVSELTLKIIRSQYRFRKHVCTDIYYSTKRYLPRWFTDIVYQLFYDKSTLKGKDPLNYQISKGKLNSCYGMCVQKAIQNEIVENYDTGEYSTLIRDGQTEYNKYLHNRKKVLPYMWGCWVTEYAQYNLLMRLGPCAGTWIYSDTDSVYGVNFDRKAIKAYNDECIKILTDRGYPPVVCEGKTYALGVATLDGEYTEFKTVGAKRYTCRSVKDNKLKITVAGVPKKGVEALKDDINNFAKGLIFPGTVSGKKAHEYRYVEEIYTDPDGNITGDSINLTPCDYLLDDINIENWLSFFEEDIVINAYRDE